MNLSNISNCQTDLHLPNNNYQKSLVLCYYKNKLYTGHAYHQVHQQDRHEHHKLHKDDICQDAEGQLIVQKGIQDVILVVQFPDHHHKGLDHGERHRVELPLMTKTK